MNEYESVLNDGTDAHTKELERLEWKYLENSINLVSSLASLKTSQVFTFWSTFPFQVKTQRDLQDKIESDIVNRTNEAVDRKFTWWSDFLFHVSKNSRLEQQMMDRIFNELRNYSNPAIDE